MMVMQDWPIYVASDAAYVSSELEANHPLSYPLTSLLPHMVPLKGIIPGRSKVRW